MSITKWQNTDRNAPHYCVGDPQAMADYVASLNLDKEDSKDKDIKDKLIKDLIFLTIGIVLMIIGGIKLVPVLVLVWLVSDS